MTAITIYPETKEQESLYKQLAKTLNNKIEKSVYNPAFVEKIEKGKKQKKEKQVKSIRTKDLWK
jgi:hypothetical protein